MEDDAIIALALQQGLLSLGHQVCAVAATAADALEAAGAHQPDLVLMDIRLHGDEDGISAAEKIWNRFRIRSLFTSAFDAATTRVRTVAAEPLGFLAKPYRLDELRRTLDDLPIRRVAC